MIWLGVTMCSMIALVRGSYYIIDWHSSSKERLSGLVPGIYYKAMDAALREAPAMTSEIYVLPAAERRESLQDANPKYVRSILGISAEIVRVVDIYWRCSDPDSVVEFDHNFTNGVVNLTVSLPECARFRFLGAPFAGASLADGRLYRNEAINYEFPEAYLIRSPRHEPMERLEAGEHFYVGRHIIAHVRPSGHARFIIDHGSRSGIAWFDAP
jgi:hypothetical protein